MKKTLSIALAIIMTFALSTVAFAATNADVTFNVPVYYVSENAGTIKPADTFTVTIGANETANAPTFTSNTATLNFDQSTAKEDVQFAVFTVNGSSLKAVGTYTYNMTIAASESLAGVVTDTKHATLTVYVTQGETADEFIAYYKIEYNNSKVTGGEWSETDQKYNKTQDTTNAGAIFTNTYYAAAPDEESSETGFAVTKTVAGNFGDKSKEFNVTVTFTSTKKVGAPVKYTDGTEKELQFVKSGENYVATTVITVKHGETVTFANVPYDVTYSIEEDVYEGYTTTYTHKSGTINAASISAGIINTYNSQIDTGVFLDYAPYIILITFVAAGVVIMIMRKRKVEEI